MPLLGQASGGWSESSSSLRILHLGVRNTVGVLTTDAFTQTNPSMVTATSTISSNVDTSVLGVLSGSVAFTRPDGGANQIGGNIEAGLTAVQEFNIKPLGLFINNAVGHAYENTPGPASGKGPYVSAQGTYASSLFETEALAASGGAAGLAAGDDLTYQTGQNLIASRNGFLMPTLDASAINEQLDVAAISANAEHTATANASTVLGILKMPSDATQAEIVFDLRV